MQQKMVIVKQSSAKDCGPCCLQSIIRHYDGYVSLEKIRDDCNTTIKGTTVYHLVKAAKRYGFDALAKKYLDKNISEIKLPAIVHVHYENGFEHFVCLYGIEKEKVILMDPAKGKEKMPINNFLNIFTGITIELSPHNNIIHFDKNNTLLDLFFRILAVNKKLVMKLLLSSILFVMLTIIYGFYFKVNYQSLEMFNKLNITIVIIFLTILVIKIIIAYLKNYFENDLNKKIDLTIINQFLEHIFNLPLKVINHKSTGEIVTRIDELYNLKDLFSQIFINMFVEMILGFGTLIILIIINKTLTFIILIALFLYVICSLLVNAYLYKRIIQNIDVQTKFNSTLIENIRMINSYKNLSIENVAQRSNKKHLYDIINDNHQLNNLFNIINAFKNCILEMGVFVLNTYGFYLIYQNNLSFIDLVLFNSIMSYFIEPVKNAINLLPKINYLRASYLRICDFIDIDEEKVGRKGKFKNGGIIFNNVHFSYNGYNDILNGINLKIKQGEKVLLNGKSGSGKSTICALIEKIYNPSQGTITIAGKNIFDYSIKTIRSNITYVSQKEELISGTIKENILLACSDQNNFDHVCEICMLEDIISKKQFRYESGIDANDSDLSGGEKQRIILARALLKDSNIIILDEALSEVDLVTEEKIISNIINAYPQKTIVYISHKNHSKLFDKVINFETINNISK